MKQILIGLLFFIILSAGFGWMKSSVSEKEIPVVVGESSLEDDSRKILDRDTKNTQKIPEKKSFTKTKQVLESVNFISKDGRKFFIVFKREIEPKFFQIVLQSIDPTKNTPIFYDWFLDCNHKAYVELSQWTGSMSEEPPVKMDRFYKVSPDSLSSSVSHIFCN